MKRAILTKYEQNALKWYSFDALDALGFFKHWITTRSGGVSKGGYAQLNLSGSVGDNEKSVRENRRIAENLFCDGKNIFLPKQTHGTKILEVSDTMEENIEADILIFKQPAFPGGILTADCLPIIIADPVKKMAALIHAGRNGIFSKILTRAVSHLQYIHECEPSNMTAVIGPGIRNCCYDINDDVFEGKYNGYKKYKTSAGTLDLVNATQDQLATAAVPPQKIYDSCICTSCHSDEFFSHRKLRGKTGRFLTALAL